jgi:Carboxypeptidase regulatory-like domain
VRRVLAIALGFAMTASAVPFAAPLPAGRAAQQTPATGAIHGKATDSSGQPMPNYTVQLRNLADGHLAGTTTANAAGGFSFEGLPAGNYIVEVVSPAGAIVGSTAAIPVAAGATVSVSVAATAAGAIVSAAPAAAATSGGMSTAMIVTTVAATAGVVGAVAVAKHKKDASPSR